ncbi:luciferase family oxidoreductase, group 1 [compost metagenome]
MLGILTGKRGQLPPPVQGFMQQLHPQEQAAIADFLAAGVIGGPDTVREGLQSLADATQADEFMIVSDLFDPALRLRSLTITAEAMASHEVSLPAQVS